MKYQKHFSVRQTPQTEPMRDDQIENSAGGFGWGIDDWTRLERFLILGTEGGTYYVNEKALTVENAKAVVRCIQSDGSHAVNTIKAISHAGRAVKNDSALFALALATSPEIASTETRKLAFDVLPEVARTPTMLFQFVDYMESVRGWGRLAREGVSNWYNSKDVSQLAYHLVKYRQRNGWTNGDVLNKAHPHPIDKAHRMLYQWACLDIAKNVPPIVEGFVKVQQTEDVNAVVNLIREYHLPREAVPTWALKSPWVWDALLDEMPLMALIRNLSTLSRVGLLIPHADDTIRLITAKLTDATYIRKARIHPLFVYNALKTYEAGHNEHKQTWKPVPQIVKALDDAFYMAFDAIEPTEKRYYVGVDISGSMNFSLSTMPGVTCAEAALVMAMTWVKREPLCEVGGFNDTLIPFNLNSSMTLAQARKSVPHWSGGRTDCSQPIAYALHNALPIDVFVVITDNETWAGKVHPAQALKTYRELTGINAKMVVVAMTSSGFTIADPTDPGMLDVVGFDTSVPSVISEFVRG